ncbi:hypothetical protein ABVK25_006999 [Lepraria finkii]|uniref:Uncharacterized protein n=1 Tax=Lepraria finkii TaxID=1340010 RepID=A0ABR4B7C7_9LECA
MMGEHSGICYVKSTETASSGSSSSNKQSDFSRHQNLQFIYKQMASYLDDQGVRYTRLTDFDLKKMSMDKSSSSVIKFLKLVLLVAISPANPVIIANISNFPIPVKNILMALVQELDPSLPSSDDGEGAETSDPDSGPRSSRGSAASSPTGKKDRELILEEDLAKVNARLARRDSEVKNLRAENEEIRGAYNRLNESYEAVKQLSAENEDQIKKLSSVHNEREQLSVKDLQAKISQLEDAIGHQESQIVEHQSTEADLERKINKLRSVDDKLQKLQDDFHIQKGQLEEQTKRANRGDHYKRKCEANQHIERERDSLRQQLDEARPRLQAYDDTRRENTRLQQENHEKLQTLSRSERDNNELREMKQSYLAEIDRLKQDTKGMREVLAQGQERIADLEERSGGSEIHSSPTVVDGGLESELAETSKHEEQTKTRIVELEKENRQLASNASEIEAKLTALQRQLENSQELSTDQEKQVQGMRQEVSGLQISLAEVRQGHPIEGTETFKKMREQLKIEQKRRFELEEKLSAAQKEIEVANDERALIDKPKLQVIEEVKKRCAVALMQLQNEHDALRLRHTVLQGKLDEKMDERNEAWQEAHEVLIAKSQADSDNQASNQGLIDLKNMIKKFSADKSAQSTTHINEALERNVDIFATKIEEGRERLAKQQQQIEKQDSLIKDLEDRLHQQNLANESVQSNAGASEGAKAETTPSPEERSYIQNLERENKLMASAYYDLASRLQMNNVILQRRAEVPKSWLGRQRKAMEAVGGLVR